MFLHHDTKLLAIKDLRKVTAADTLAGVTEALANWHVGDVVKKRRQAKGLTQKALAKRAHVHHNTIVRLEDGDEGVQSRTLKAVAAALGASVRDLYEAVPQEIDRSLIRDLQYAIEDLRRTVGRASLDDQAVRDLALKLDAVERIVDRLPEGSGLRETIRSTDVPLSNSVPAAVLVAAHSSETATDSAAGTKRVAIESVPPRSTNPYGQNAPLPRPPHPTQRGLLDRVNRLTRTVEKASGMERPARKRAVGEHVATARAATPGGRPRARKHRR